MYRKLASGDRHQIADGIEFVHIHFAKSIGRQALCRFPWLLPDDLADAWQETLLGLAQRCWKRKFDPNKDIKGLLRTIMHRRVMDGLRHNRRLRATLVAYIEGLCRSLVDIEAVAEEDGIDDELLAKVLAAVHEVIPKLRGRQKEVWEVYASLGFCASLKALTAAVSDACGQPISKAIVRHAKDSGKENIRKHLKRRGDSWLKLVT
jgi:hypothetical protein